MSTAYWEPLHPYARRNYLFHKLDDTVFDLLNDGQSTDLLTLTLAGCLDAIDIIPAGSMLAPPESDQYRTPPSQRYINRDTMHWSPEERAERDAWFRSLIDEIIAEAKQ